MRKTILKWSSFQSRLRWRLCSRRSSVVWSNWLLSQLRFRRSNQRWPPIPHCHLDAYHWTHLLPSSSCRWRTWDHRTVCLNRRPFLHLHHHLHVGILVDRPSDFRRRDDRTLYRLYLLKSYGSGFSNRRISASALGDWGRRMPHWSPKNTQEPHSYYPAPMHLDDTTGRVCNMIS